MSMVINTYFHSLYAKCTFFVTVYGHSKYWFWSKVGSNQRLCRYLFRIKLWWVSTVNPTSEFFFIRPSRDGPYYVIGYGGHPHRFLHNNFSSVYRIITKLGHMIPLWKEKNPIYFGVIRSKVTVTINRIFDNIIVCTR